MKSSSPVLILIAGPNGSGKTSITHKILKHEWLQDCEYINPDNIANEKFGSWNETAAVLNAAKYATEWRYSCLEKNTSLIFETVFSSQEKIDFILQAKNLGYFIRIFFIGTDGPTVNAARVAQRVMEGGHDVPINKIISRYTKSIDNCAYIAPYIDRLYIYDNSIDFEEPKLLFRFKNGKFEKSYGEINKWAEPILNAVL